MECFQLKTEVSELAHRLAHKLHSTFSALLQSDSIDGWGTLDCKFASLTGKPHDRDLYVRPPKDGLPGSPLGSLLKLVKGAYGLREAPRLWYLRANDVLLDARLEELQTANSCFANRAPTTKEHFGMFVLRVDDACVSGEVPLWENALNHIRKHFTLGKEEYGTFIFLGRQVHQTGDYRIELHQTDYVNAFDRGYMSRERRGKSGDKLTEEEKHHYSSRAGQLAWLARETMPQLSYSVSDLHQNVETATVCYLIHAHNVLCLARQLVDTGHKLHVLHLDNELDLGVSLTEQNKTRLAHRDTQHIQMGMAIAHDASFMDQAGESSQQAYAFLLATKIFVDGKAKARLLDWGSSNIHRKMKSTLACDSSSAARAVDRGSFARTMIYDVERDLQHQFEICITDAPERRAYWERICHPLPMAIGTYCTSLYDVCHKTGSLPDERRVAFDL